MHFDKRTGIWMFKPPISADIHCVFWTACADTVPALSPLFHGRMGWAERFFAGFGNWCIATNRKQKIPSQVTGKIMFKPEVTNMRPAKEFPAAREHFGETSTFKHFFPV